MALNENRLDVAERLLKPHLKDDPFDVAAIRMLAELAARIGRWRDAENLLRRALEIAPEFTAARANLALVLGRMGRPAEALELLDDIFAAEPDDLGALEPQGGDARPAGRFRRGDPAVRRRARARRPNQPRVWLSYGHMLKTVGRQAEGIDRLPQGDRDQADAGRGVVEPGQPQDRQVRRGRRRGDASRR